MLTLISSKIHRFPVVMIFQGDSGKSKIESKYFYRESALLFGEGNLASNLLEYDTNYSDVKNFLEGSGVSVLAAEFRLENENTKMTYIDIVLVDESKADIVLEYSEKSIYDKLPYLFGDAVGGQYGYDVASSQVVFGDELFTSKFFTDSYFARLKIRRKFIDSASKSLSDRLKNAFSEKTYVDSQVPIFLLSTIIAGFAQATAKLEKD